MLWHGTGTIGEAMIVIVWAGFNTESSGLATDYGFGLHKVR